MVNASPASLKRTTDQPRICNSDLAPQADPSNPTLVAVNPTAEATEGKTSRGPPLPSWPTLETEGKFSQAPPLLAWTNLPPFRRASSFLGQEQGFHLFDVESLYEDYIDDEGKTDVDTKMRSPTSLDLPDLDMPALLFDMSENNPEDDPGTPTPTFLKALGHGFSQTDPAMPTSHRPSHGLCSQADLSVATNHGQSNLPPAYAAPVRGILDSDLEEEGEGEEDIEPQEALQPGVKVEEEKHGVEMEDIDKSEQKDNITRLENTTAPPARNGSPQPVAGSSSDNSTTTNNNNKQGQKATIALLKPTPTLDRKRKLPTTPAKHFPTLCSPALPASLLTTPEVPPVSRYPRRSISFKFQPLALPAAAAAASSSSSSSSSSPPPPPSSSSSPPPPPPPPSPSLPLPHNPQAQPNSSRYPKRRRRPLSGPNGSAGPGTMGSTMGNTIFQYTAAVTPGDNLVKIGDYTRAERRAKIAHFKRKWKKIKTEGFVRYRRRSNFANHRPRIGGRFVKMEQPIDDYAYNEDEEEMEAE